MYLCQQRAAKSQGIGDEVSIRSAMACLKGSGGFSAVGRKLEQQKRGQRASGDEVGIWLTSIPHIKAETSSIYVKGSRPGSL